MVIIIIIIALNSIFVVIVVVIAIIIITSMTLTPATLSIFEPSKNPSVKIYSELTQTP